MLTRDDVLKELIRLFDEEMYRDSLGMLDWLAQGEHDVDEFVAAVDRTKKALALRDGPQ
jgi:hypothetical protein